MKKISKKDIHSPEKLEEFIYISGKKIKLIIQYYKDWDIGKHGRKKQTDIWNHKRFKKILKGIGSRTSLYRYINGDFSSKDFLKRRDKWIDFINKFSEFSEISPYMFIDEGNSSNELEITFKNNWEQLYKNQFEIFEIELTKNKLEKSFINLPATDNTLFGRDNYFNLLNQAWMDNKTNILTFIAPGGVGKTALINNWLLYFKSQNFKDAEIIYGFSFYKQGAYENTQSSADQFMNEALNFFDEKDNLKGSSWEKGKRLAKLIKKQRTLFILDGLEPLQDPLDEKIGRLNDQGIESLLKGLAFHNNGLCIITSRIPIYDIKNMVTPKEFINLENISVNSGIKLLKYLGVKNIQNRKNDDKEFEKTVSEFDCHALALKLLGNYLRVVYEGDIRRKDKIPVLLNEKIEGGHAKRVVKGYEEWLKRELKGIRALELLYIMGLFDRPAKFDTIKQVLLNPAIKGLTDNIFNISEVDLLYTISLLRSLDLILPTNSQNDYLDCHPLIREYFREKLKRKNKKAWKEANDRLYNYYKKLPEKYQPDTLEDMEPLFIAVKHGCEAGLFKEVDNEIIFKRIRREHENYHIVELGAFGKDLEMFSSFFISNWDQIHTEMTDEIKAGTYAWVGFDLKALGRLKDALEPMEKGLEINLKRKDWFESAKSAGTLCDSYLKLGNIDKSIYYAKKAIYFSDKSDNIFLSSANRSSFAYTLFNNGNLSEAEKIFQEAEGLQKLYSIWCYYYCEFLLEKKLFDKSIDKIIYLLDKGKEKNSLLEKGLGYLSFSKYYLLKNDKKRANEYILLSLKYLRQSGRKDFLISAILLHSKLLCLSSNTKSANLLLEEASELIYTSEMKLFLVDYYIELIQLYLINNKKNDANKNIVLTDKLIKKMGYHIKNKEVKKLKLKVRSL